MAKHKIIVEEQITYLHEIVVEYSDQAELNKIISNLPEVDEHDDFWDYVTKVEKIATVVDTNEEFDWRRRPIEYCDDIPEED